MAKESESVYYVALSGLQKALRRCMEKPALNMARIAWTLEPYRMWQRLAVILYEDAGRDADAIRFFAGWKGSYKNWQDVSCLVETLVNAKKSHDAVGASWIVTGEVDFPECSERLAMIRDSWATAGFDAYRNAGHPLPWLVDACQRAAKTMHEKLSIGAPLLHWHSAQTNETENQAPEENLLGEVLLPSSALDKRTWAGRFVNGVLWKQIGQQAAEYGIEKADLGMVLFVNEGSLLNSRVVAEPDFWQVACGVKGWARFAAPELREWISETVIPKVRELRQWALAKVYPDLLGSLAAVLDRATVTDSLPRLLFD